MQKQLTQCSPFLSFRNQWKDYHPYTNVLWLHYLADKMLKATKYPNSSSKEHKSMARQFRTFHRDALDFSSAGHLIYESSFFT